MSADGIFYAVVYGSGWEHVDYFSSFQKARIKLIVQTLGFLRGQAVHHPMIVEYSKDPYGGTYGMTKNMYAINAKDLDKLLQFDVDKIRESPMIADHLIELVF